MRRLLSVLAVTTLMVAMAMPAAADTQYNCNYDVATGNQNVTGITPIELAELISLRSSGELGNLMCAMA
jgi:hypothetical protein